MFYKTSWAHLIKESDFFYKANARDTTNKILTAFHMLFTKPHITIFNKLIAIQ